MVRFCIAVLCSVLALPGCGSLLLDDEGREPGECTDGADNDADGLYDCEDPDCERAPDCDPDQAEEETEDPCEGYDYDDFYADWIDVICHRYDNCGFLTSHFTLAECLALADRSHRDTGGRPFQCRDWSCAAALACLGASQAASCDDLMANVGLEACGEVCSND